MKHYFTKKWFIFSAIICSLFFFSNQVQAKDFSVAAKHAIAVEVSSGKILYEQDAQTPASIASITKLLTVYLVYEAIEKGEITLDTVVPISDYPYNLTLTAVSNVKLDAREYTVRDLLNASLITSANSAAIALAEKIAGSEPAFVDKMKAKLNEWGIKKAKLVNVTGLNNAYIEGHLYPKSSKTDENQMSARDVAFVARRLILDYPEVLNITSQYSYNFVGATYYSTNQMLKNGTHFRAGVDGLKTGTTDKSGASFVATTKQKGMRIITVVLNANDGEQYPDNRFVATNELIDYVYENFTVFPLVKKGETYKNSKVEIFNGQSATSKAVAEEDLLAVVKIGKEAAVSADYTATETLLEAPVEKNKLLGTITLKDKELIGQGYLDDTRPSVHMVTKKTVPEAIWPISWWNHFVRYVNENL